MFQRQHALQPPGIPAAAHPLSGAGRAMIGSRAVAGVRQSLLAFTRLPRFERLLLVPTWLLLGAARGAVRWIGFRHLARWVGHQMAVPPALPRLDERAQRRALQIGRTVRLAARHTPWRSNCLAQALASHCLLVVFRVAHVLCLGVARSADGAALQAHAWVVAGSQHVTGGHGTDRFTRVGCFVPYVWPPQ
ncbi:lasso peptide biosynthesis B2 protein [Xanthomonas cassavae CFBP 4642]|uniref:Lasso peptide biosynthesis B2 protein n=1 Tax=Xanthomonas cassavae CFBP 4642 TaxID=1219375 RepID=A0ABS8HGB9_9XANT|nr:lasso peptide biosynthesis B2 protein [Xanthomonas cassavae]MCC4619702.1 lasso peptide biosynthesis B2 protein [Xanthomonas cassavae CFBP 4642]